MMTKRALRILAFALLLVGCIGWFSGGPWIGPQFEMPLGDLRGIAVDSYGNIYCGAQFYSRVQKYDPNGKFLFGLGIGAGSGAFRIRVNEHDELEVATARTNQLYRFSPEGELLERKDDVDHFFSEFGAKGERQCSGPGYAVYRIKNTFLFPSVVRPSSGKDEPVVSVPFHKWLVMAPCPAWLFFGAGILILLGLERQKEREKKGQPQPALAADAEKPRR